ncbi:hypothetical protein, partial [Burkholderia multivorans]|uniref:hypothetical protein n=1 Tax=Burkholderia multivorans TaxID=87883 RepID=UPI0011B94C4A
DAVEARGLNGGELFGERAGQGTGGDRALHGRILRRTGGAARSPQDPPMQRSIATVSLSGTLAEKLAAIQAAGFDGV